MLANSHGSSNDLAAFIGGAVGGFALLLMIIVLLCIVVLCMRRSHRKEDKNVSCNTAQLNTDVNFENNPSYDATQVIEPRDSDVPFTINPSYSVSTRSYSKTSEYIMCDYIQPDEFTQHSDLDGSIQMDTNPSYGVSIGKEKSTALDTTSDKITYRSSHDATAKEYDYAYASNDRFLHPSSNTGGAKQDNVQIHTDSHNIKIPHSYYLMRVTNNAESTGGGRK